MDAGPTGTTEEGREDDAAVVRRVLAGEPGLYGVLVDRYGKRLFWSCRRMLGDADEAEDTVQETFVRAYRHLAEYDPSRRFYTWIYAIARNRCLNAIRRRKTWGVSAVPDPEPELASPDDASARVERREVAAALAACLETLPEEQRACFDLRHGEEMSYAEIGAVLEIPQGTVMSRLARAREKMRACLEARGVR